MDQNKVCFLENIEKFDETILDHVTNIGITASASAPEILVKNFIINVEKENMTVIVHEPKYVSENVSFKIPQQLKSSNLIYGCLLTYY